MTCDRPNCSVCRPKRKKETSGLYLWVVLTLILILTSMVFIIIDGAMGAEPDEEYPGAFLTKISVVDGDTIKATINLGFDIVLADQTIRCYDYDAWESTKIRRSVDVTDEEVKKGKVAKAYLEELLKKSKVVTVSYKGRDNYGRILGIVYADGKPIADIMKQKGHSRDKAVDEPPTTETAIFLFPRRKPREREKGDYFGLFEAQRQEAGWSPVPRQEARAIMEGTPQRRYYILPFNPVPGVQRKVPAQGGGGTGG